MFISFGFLAGSTALLKCLSKSALSTYAFYIFNFFPWLMGYGYYDFYWAGLGLNVGIFGKFSRPYVIIFGKFLRPYVDSLPYLFRTLEF